MKIWGKLLVDDKVIKSVTIEVNPKNISFFEMLQNLSHELNVPTPVLLDKHVYDFNMFHLCVFKPDDFIEKVNFSRFVLEYLKN